VIYVDACEGSPLTVRLEVAADEESRCTLGLGDASSSGGQMGRLDRADDPGARD
jgi:hypothetical protein